MLQYYHSNWHHKCSKLNVLIVKVSILGSNSRRPHPLALNIDFSQKNKKQKRENTWAIKWSLSLSTRHRNRHHGSGCVSIYRIAEDAHGFPIPHPIQHICIWRRPFVFKIRLLPKQKPENRQLYCFVFVLFTGKGVSQSCKFFC